MDRNNQTFEKLIRAEKRGYFKTADLFAGCGGLSLGFHRAGFKSSCAIEINHEAKSSHHNNFSQDPGGRYASFSDIRKTSPEEAVAHLMDDCSAEEAIDIIIGGPPCQAFSRLGRAALWRLADKDFAHAEDDRATYYEDYLRYVHHLKPIAFVMENVREIGKFAGRNIAEEISVTAENMGYVVKYSLLNSVWYGVPQLRERMFIIGIRKELGVIPSFPKIQYSYDLPVGYSTSSAGKAIKEVLEPRDHFFDHADIVACPLPAITVAEAFADLPKIFHHLDGRAGKGYKRNVLGETKYADTGSRYSNEMRNWPDFKAGESFTGHIIRYTPRDYETFRRMPHGGMYPEALETAIKIFYERLEEFRLRTGRDLLESDPEFEQLWTATVPPYKVNRYPNKFRKMWPDHPARTVPAHIGKDGYSHIHFDSEQARCISVREAARLQSFPDAFRFAGTMNKQLTQIGNAVPPLLAFAVASNLSVSLKSALKPNNVYEIFEEGDFTAA